MWRLILVDEGVVVLEISVFGGRRRMKGDNEGGNVALGRTRETESG